MLTSLYSRSTKAMEQYYLTEKGKGFLKLFFDTRAATVVRGQRNQTEGSVSYFHQIREF